MMVRFGRQRPLRSTRLTPFSLMAIGVSLLIAGASTALARALSYDAWGWLLWGQEMLGGRRFTTDGYPTWKPLTGLIAALITPLGDAAPFLWLVIARAGALMALFLAYRLASRLAGPAAGVLAALALLIVPEWLFQSGVGGSEPLLTALLLGAVARHVDRHDLQGFGLVMLASLLRPESWPLLLGSAVVAWQWSPRSRAVIAASLAAIPAIWFGGEYLGSGDPFRGGQLAKTTQEAVRLRRMWALPGVGVLHIGWQLIPLPLLLCVPAALVRALRRYDPIVLALGLGALIWIAEVAVLAQLGYAGVTRFLFPAAAGLAVVGSAGLVHLLTSPRVTPAARIALIAVAVALALPSAPHVLQLGRAARDVHDRAGLDNAVSVIVGRVGRHAFLAGRHVVAQGETITPLAWRLDAPAETLKHPHFPGLALADARQPWSVFRRALRRGGRRFTTRTVASEWPLRLISVELRHVPRRRRLTPRSGARPNRPGRTAAVQRAGDGRRVRVRPDPPAHPRGHEGRQSQRSAPRQPKLNPRQEAHLVELHRAGEHSTAELGDLFLRHPIHRPSRHQTR